MPVSLTTNLAINATKASDNRYGKEVSGATVPFASVSEADTAIVSQRRHIGLTIMVDDGSGTKEYWLKNNLTTFVLKQSELGTFVTLTSTAWNGSEVQKSLSADEAWTLDTTKTVGVAWITGNGHTLTINGVSIPLDPSTFTLVTFVRNGSLYGFDSNYRPIGGTAPVISSLVATGAHTIAVTLNQAFTGSTGFTFKRAGTALTVTASSSPGVGVMNYTITETLAVGDVLTADYAPGNIVSTGGALAAFTGRSVVNSVPAGASWQDDSFDTSLSLVNTGGVWTNSGGGSGWGYRGTSAKKILQANDGKMRSTWHSDAGNFAYGLGPSSANDITGFGEYEVGFSMSPSGDAVKIIDGTQTPVTAGLVDGDIVELSFVGTAFTLSKIKASDGTSSTLATWTHARSADWYSRLDEYGAGFGKCYHPQVYNFS